MLHINVIELVVLIIEKHLYVGLVTNKIKFESMKWYCQYFMVFLFVHINGGVTVIAQENERQIKNPFSLSERKIQRLLYKSCRVVEQLSAQYSDSNLLTWPKTERSIYLKAKATKIVLLFAPDFYREYNFEITRKFANRHSQSNSDNVPYYQVTFFYDTRKEKLDNKGIAIYVNIWEDNGQAFGCFIPAYDNYGCAFEAPDWEDGLYIKWKNEKIYPFPYRIPKTPLRNPFIARTKAQMDSLREYLNTHTTEEVDSLRKLPNIP